MEHQVPRLSLSVVFKDKRLYFFIPMPPASDPWVPVFNMLPSEVVLEHYVAKRVLNGVSAFATMLEPSRTSVRDLVNYACLVAFIRDNELLPFITSAGNGCVVYLSAVDDRLVACCCRAANLRLKKRRLDLAPDDEPQAKRVCLGNTPENVLHLVEKHIFSALSEYPVHSLLPSLRLVSSDMHTSGIEKLLTKTDASMAVRAAVLPSLIDKCRPPFTRRWVDLLASVVNKESDGHAPDTLFIHISWNRIVAQLNGFAGFLDGASDSQRELASQAVRLLLSVLMYRPSPKETVVFADVNHVLPLMISLDPQVFDMLLHSLPDSWKTLDALPRSLIAVKAIYVGNTALAMHIFRHYPISLTYPLSWYFAFCACSSKYKTRSIAGILLDNGFPFTDPFIMEFAVQRGMFELFDVLLQRGHPFHAPSLLERLASKSQWNFASEVSKRASLQAVEFRFTDATLRRMDSFFGMTQEKAFDTLFDLFCSSAHSRIPFSLPNPPLDAKQPFDAKQLVPPPIPAHPKALIPGQAKMPPTPGQAKAPPIPGQAKAPPPCFVNAPIKSFKFY
jgi:hypothetical protein